MDSTMGHRSFYELERLLEDARAYAHNLAVSIYGQHYADESPNWRPFPDLMGLLTQINNMYAGLRNDLSAAKEENKRLVGLPLAKAQAENNALRAALKLARSYMAAIPFDQKDLRATWRKDLRTVDAALGDVVEGK